MALFYVTIYKIKVFFYKEDLRDSGNLYYGIFMNLLGTNLIDENMQENMVIQTTF